MAPPPSSSSPSSSKSPPPPPHQSPCFTPIQECEREEQRSEHIGCTATPLHHPSEKKAKLNSKKRQDQSSEEDGSVSCNKCRPHSREKISVVPLDNNNNNGINKSSSFMASPNGIFKSIFHSLMRKSPKSMDTSSAREEQWRIAVAELSQKLMQATRKRDEALSEAYRLKYSMTELEKKLNKLEVYCDNLKSGLEECSSNSPYRLPDRKVCIPFS